MKSDLRPAARAAGPVLAMLLAWVSWSALLPRGAPAEGLVLVPFAVDAARRPRVCAAQLLVYHPLEGEAPARLRRLRLLSGELVLYERALDLELEGEREYGEVSALIERLPEELTELRRPRRFFAAQGEPAFEADEAVERWREVAGRVDRMRRRYAAGAPRPFAQIDLPLPLDQIFAGDETPGTVARLRFEVTYETGLGLARVQSVEHAVRWLGPPLAPPAPIPSLGGAASVHAGDLHVHSCHGEAVGACPPSDDCAAESLQTSGSFSYAQLKSQYQALGLDWFAATDHSYCINDAAEYQAIAGEIAAIVDAGFAAFADTELTSREAGAQSGPDQANALCLFLAPQNHMGAHGISSRKPGGDDGFLGFCSNLAGFEANAAAVRAEGGYPIVNHPSDPAFAWNSISATGGILEGEMHGVEIWNGSSAHVPSGQGGHAATWVSWLLGGRLLYAYSGSDTHDAAFAFGANHVLLAEGEPFTPAGVQRALMGGRAYLSNRHALVLEVELDGRPLAMGSVHALTPGQGPLPAGVRVHYDFGADTASITVYSGRAGDASEGALCQSGALSGQGTFSCPAAAGGAGMQWFRAFSQSQQPAGLAAYTNPVFLLPDAGAVATYCTAKTSSLGCVPEIGWRGAPSASLASPFTVEARGVRSNANGLLFYGSQPHAAPFQGGFLCVRPPLARTRVASSGGNPPPADCSGLFVFDFQGRIRSGADPALVQGATVFAQFWYRDPPSPSGTGLTDGLRFTILP